MVVCWARWAGVFRGGCTACGSAWLVVGPHPVCVGLWDIAKPLARYFSKFHVKWTLMVVFRRVID